MCVCSTHGHQKRVLDPLALDRLALDPLALDPLALELAGCFAVPSLSSVLGTDLRFSVRPAHRVNRRPPLCLPDPHIHPTLDAQNTF